MAEGFDIHLCICLSAAAWVESTAVLASSTVRFKGTDYSLLVSLATASRCRQDAQWVSPVPHALPSLV